MNEFLLKKNLLDSFMKRAAKEQQLLPSHLSLVMAVFHLADNFGAAVQISRKKLMHFSRIKSVSTYHKCISELERFGYLEYEPSYHPLHGSKIKIVDNGLTAYGELVVEAAVRK